VHAVVAPKIRGSILVTVGYILSPFSWWNDPFVNIPIAYFFGMLFALISPRLFSPAMVVGYWLTNIAGLSLLSAGSIELAALKHARLTRRVWIVNLAVSAVYSVVIVALIHFKVLRFPWKGAGR
jgi:hypothetical protein